jgi:hypothetical protein
MKYTLTTVAGVPCYCVPCDELDALRAQIEERERDLAQQKLVITGLRHDHLSERDENCGLKQKLAASEARVGAMKAERDHATGRLSEIAADCLTLAGLLPGQQMAHLASAIRAKAYAAIAALSQSNGGEVGG